MRNAMLIGGDDISSDIITLGRCFSMFVHIHAHFHFVLIGGNLTAKSVARVKNLHGIHGKSVGSHRGIRGGIQIPAS